MNIRKTISILTFHTLILFTSEAISQPNEKEAIINNAVDIIDSRDISQLAKLVSTSEISIKLSKFKHFELERTKASARALFSTIPSIDTSSNQVKKYNFDNENIFSDLLTALNTSNVDRVKEGKIYLFLQMDVPDLLAEAAIQYPEGISSYISYAFIAENELEGEYETTMRKVCRSRYHDFVKAYNRLNRSHKAYFDSNILNIKNCQLPNFQ